MTLAVAAIAAALPERSHTTLVGFVFLAATWSLVWRRDDATVRASAGLALAGLVIPGPLRPAQVARDAATSCAWAFGLMAIIAVPFFFGWRAWWMRGALPHLHFALAVGPVEACNEILGQLFVIALPEEAFSAWRVPAVAPRRGVDAALARPSARTRRSPGWLVAAAIFAAGHLATVHMPTRLAVFFPALLFGWLRARTGGIGASLTFHMLCNVYSQTLGRGYGSMY